MSVIIILMLASIAVAALFLGAFIWNVKRGQYDDEVGPAIRILFPDNKSLNTTTVEKAAAGVPVPGPVANNTNDLNKK